MSAFRKLSSIYVFSYFPFGFEGRIWDLVVSVPDHCLSFYFTMAERTSRAKSRKPVSRPRRSDDNYVDLLERSGIRVPKGLTRNMIKKLYEANADKMHNRSRSRSPLVSDCSEPARDSNETTVHSDTPNSVIPDLSVSTGASSLSSTENVNYVISISLNTLNTTIQAFNSTVEKNVFAGTVYYFVSSR